MNENELINDMVDNLREDYYEVALFMEGEEDAVEVFYDFGTPVDIVFCMDATLDSYGYGNEDWSKMSACITFPGESRDYDLLYMSDLTEPVFDVIADKEVLEALAASSLGRE